MSVKFDIDSNYSDTVTKIVTRIRKIEREIPMKPRSTMDWRMDVIATHANGNPLDLAKLLSADDFNFEHDMFGICRHLDRSTGKLLNHFSPRCSA